MGALAESYSELHCNHTGTGVEVQRATQNASKAYNALDALGMTRRDETHCRDLRTLWWFDSPTVSPW